MLKIKCSHLCIIFRTKKRTQKWQAESSIIQLTLTIETANEAGMKEKAILTMIAAEKASRSYIISSTVHQIFNILKSLEGIIQQRIDTNVRDTAILTLHYLNFLINIQVSYLRHHNPLCAFYANTNSWNLGWAWLHPTKPAYRVRDPSTLYTLFQSILNQMWDLGLSQHTTLSPALLGLVRGQ